MKLVTAIIRKERLDHVKAALKQAGVGGLTITETKGFGVQGGTVEVYRGAEYVDDMHPKVELRAVVPDDQLAKVLGTIVYGARTGKIGDGKVWWMPVDGLVRVRTGEEGDDAL